LSFHSRVTKRCLQDNELISVKYCLLNDRPRYYVTGDMLTRWQFVERYVLTCRFKSGKTLYTKMFWSQVLPAVARIQRAWRRYKKWPTPPMSWWFQKQQRGIETITLPDATNEANKMQAEKQIAVSLAELQKRKVQYEQQVRRTRRRALYDSSRKEYTAAKVLCSFTV
jgi:hypothetical protein